MKFTSVLIVLVALVLAEGTELCSDKIKVVHTKCIKEQPFRCSKKRTGTCAKPYNECMVKNLRTLDCPQAEGLANTLERKLNSG